MGTREGFVTPEAVVLERDLAGLGSRFIGALVDTALQVGVLFAAGAATAAGSTGTGVVVVSVVGFLGLFGYPIVMETVTRGKTVGKMAAGTRVVRTDGRPVTFPVVMVRNLVRIVDLLPGVYAVGAISILVTRRGQRLGDLAAGTVVVYDARPRVPEQLRLDESPERDRARRGMDVAGLSAEEYGLVRSFLLRRDAMDPVARAHLAADLHRRLVDRVGSAAPDASSETFLEAVAAAYRERSER